MLLLCKEIMSMLDNFQLETGLALNDPEQQSPTTLVDRADDGSSRRFNIYRNNRAGSLTTALQESYPVLCRLVGNEFFRAAARQFIDEHPPTGPVLSEYGNGFGRFIQQLPGTANYPYLGDVAELEWQRLQSYHAANDVLLTFDDLQGLQPAQLLSSRLTPHSAVALIQSDWAIGSLWANSQTDTETSLNLSQTESVLISRPQWHIQLLLLSAEGAMFMQLLTSSLAIEEAATQCLSKYPEFDTGSHLQGLVKAGAFSNLIH